MTDNLLTEKVISIEAFKEAKRAGRAARKPIDLTPKDIKKTEEPKNDTETSLKDAITASIQRTFGKAPTVEPTVTVKYKDPMEYRMELLAEFRDTEKHLLKNAAELLKRMDSTDEEEDRRDIWKDLLYIKNSLKTVQMNIERIKEKIKNGELF